MIDLFKKFLIAGRRIAVTVYKPPFELKTAHAGLIIECRGRKPFGQQSGFFSQMFTEFPEIGFAERCPVYFTSHRIVLLCFGFLKLAHFSAVGNIAWPEWGCFFADTRGNANL